MNGGSVGRWSASRILSMTSCCVMAATITLREPQLSQARTSIEYTRFIRSAHGCLLGRGFAPPPEEPWRRLCAVPGFCGTTLERSA